MDTRTLPRLNRLGNDYSKPVELALIVLAYLAVIAFAAALGVLATLYGADLIGRWTS